MHHMWFFGLAATGVGLLMAASSGCSLAQSAASPRSTGAFDAAPFGYAMHEADEKAHGVRWAQPRKIRRLVVEFPPDVAIPPADQVHVQYWHKVWDGRPDPILAETAAGGEGWAAMDDWTNGQWKDADTQVQVDGRRWTFTFAPTGEKEFQDLKQPGVAYRKALKIRIASDEPLPRPAKLAAFTDAVCKPVKVRILFGKPAEPAIRLDGTETGSLEAFNGAVTAVRAISGTAVGLTADDGWTLAAGAEGGVEAGILMAVDPISQRYDRTIVTVRSNQRPFSFAADEVARGDRILVDDLGVLVVRGDDTISLEGCRQARKEFPGRTIYDRVAEHDEQTLSQAWDDMPLKRPLWFVHGLPGNRNVMKQEPNGDVGVSAVAHWFTRGNCRSPKDSDRKGWDGDYLWIRFGLPADKHRAGRELRDGYLPVVRTWWVDGPIYYEQTTVLDKLDGDLDHILLDDPTVLLMKVRVLNTSDKESGTASLTFSTRDDKDERLRIENSRAIAQPKTKARLRFLIQTGGKGEIAAAGDTTKWSLELKPGQSHAMVLMVPSITLDNDAEIDALAKRDFDADVRRICDFWKKMTDEGAQIETPEPWLNDFYKAHARHLQVNCLKDLTGAPRRYAHVGTFHYGVFTNESSMMVTDLDRRGYHEAAEQCIQAWLDFQGTVKLNGTFKTKDGIIYGADGAQMGSYNKHHGYGMWCMAEHWWYTRDRKWMERAAPGMIKACDWITRERQATMGTYDDGSRVFEYGLLPAGGLEDVQDFWYWTATNACAAWGFDSVAAALADYGHPEAARIQRDARAFHDDVVRAITAARVRSPVVRLRDGTYIPQFSSEVYTRGRSVGWVREVLEGSVCLLLTGMVQPDTPEARWIVQDYEDNLYISDRYGYSIPTFDRFWFSRGGFSMQANLLDSPIPYIQRDEVKHYLRTYFNSFASAFYPEIRMCNEHSLPELGYPAGDHFKSSDESQSTYWLRLMFVHEQGNELHLGQAIPRYWLADGKSVGIQHAASHFGPLSLRITSDAAKGRITAVVTPPSRNRPDHIYVRIRHPRAKPIKSVTVNDKPYDRFDVKKEWIILPGTVDGRQEITASY